MKPHFARLPASAVYDDAEVDAAKQTDRFTLIAHNIWGWTTAKVEEN